VSRQLWWGHRIPVWHIDGSGEFPTTTKFVVARNEEEAYVKAKAEHGDDVKLTQDPDVLDTWFSSGLWPFSTVGWPKDGNDPSSDFARFYSNRGSSCLETGYDILFFWVARMVMLGEELTGQIPFDTVYMHGLVRDAQGKKMSKTTGNVIDPLDTIADFGTDALRYTLSTGVTPGQDVPLDPKKIEYNRNFANKLWNSARFILGNCKDVSPKEWEELAVKGAMTAEDIAALPLPEKYIVSQCHNLVNEVTDQLEAYTLGQAGEQVQSFLWDEFADWYLEISKVRIFAAQKSDDPEVQAAAATARKVLVYVLDTSVRLLHPFMPYVTEAIWQRCPHEGDSLMMSSWPLVDESKLTVDSDSLASFKSFQSLVRSVRNARSEYKVENNKKIAANIGAEGAMLKHLIDEKAALSTLIKADDDALIVSEIKAAKDKSTEGGADGPKPVHLVVQDGLEAFLPMAGLVDFDKEIKRLTKQRDTLTKETEGLENRLKAKGFADKAPPAVVEEVKKNLADKKEQLVTVEGALAAMQK